MTNAGIAGPTKVSASDTSALQVVTAHQAVTLTTPIPHDELLAAELARLDRATEIVSRRKELQHKRTNLADERTALGLTPAPGVHPRSLALPLHRGGHE
jgi:hypothetical protein